MNDDDRNPDHKNCDMKKQSSEEDDPEAQNSKLTQKFDQGAGDGDDEQQSGQTVGKIGGDNSVAGTARMDAKASSSPQTLAMSLSTDDLQEVPVKYGLQPFESAEESKDQVTLSKKEKPKNIVDETETATVQAQKVAPDGTLSSELSPTSVTQFITSISSPAQTEQKKFSVEKRNISHLQEVGEKNSFDPKKLSIVSAQRTPSPDGYNWRKYGQKQVKSPQGSRSYYRCTHADCYAKKIECSDHSNRVMEIVYKSHHSHDPPQKVNCTRGSRLTSPIALVNGTDSSVSPTGVIADSVPSTSAVDSVHETAATPDPKQKDSSKSHDITETGAKQEQIDEPEPRKRLKKTDTSCSESPSKAMKKPKVIVHTAGDVGISGDGYRWRKYGQKMVKGNPHPRNYYRCTSAGCPVRKHIERAKENTNAAIITYKGVHDHDMPVPKKRHGPPSAPLVAAAAPTSMSTMQVVKTECAQNPESAIQWSVDKEGELKGQSLECGAEKAVDATRTLLSIGFEIKP